MVESKPLDYEIVPQDFEGCNIKFIKKDEKIWITGRAIAKGLEIDRRNVNRIYQNNKELLEPYSTVIFWVTVDNKRREVRVFDRTGFIGISMRSNSKKALPFQQWALNVIDNVLTTGQYIEKAELSPLEALLKQNEALGRMLTNQIEQQKKLLALESKVDIVNTDLKTFENRYEEEKLITPQTRRKIQDIINQCKVNSGEGWGHFHSKYKRAFGISTYKDISETLGQKIIKWMKSNPAFNRYMDLNTLNEV